nr:MAG TPA: N BRO family, N-terminal domain [Bacteriophage sp.]
MTTNNPMTVITSKPFGALNVDVYQNDKHQYYMTREQIGTALEYTSPVVAVKKIHDRYADRLDALSSITNLVIEVGNHTQMRQTYVYNLRGVMEICRFSRQPKADAFMDFCWDIMESLMRGDSVLATPKMDAALSKEFIDVRLHALFDSMKSLQSELDSTRKDLSEQIEEARATSNEALNVISSVSQCVHQIKDKQMDDAIRSTRNFTPRKDVMSDWRKKMYERINVIAAINEMRVQDVFRDVYEYMNRVYTFVIEEERRKFCARTGRTGHIPTIDIVEASTMYKSIFGALVEDLYTEAINKKKEEATEQKALPEAKAVEAAPEVDVCAAPVIEVEAKEVEPEPVVEEKPKKQSETATYLVPIIEPLAQKLGDKTIHYHKTYRMVYNKIGFTKMENMMKQYKRAHGRVPSPKTKVFLENDKAMRMFKKAVKELMKEQESK